MLRKTLVIVNPESNQGRTRKKWVNIKETFTSYLEEFECAFTDVPQQATEICRSAIKKGFELIVGVGGDGTMNEIANGFFENRAIINPHATLGIVPSGTGCDLSKSLNIPSGLSNALKIAAGPATAMIDVGITLYKNHSDEDEERYFLNVADFGIGGEVIDRMQQNREGRKASSYLKSSLATFFSFKNKKVHIKIDGKEIPKDEYVIGAIANGKIFGNGMKIAPRAILNDGAFDIILVKGMKTLQLLWNIRKIYSGSHLSHPKISFIRGKRLNAVPEDPQEKILIEIDGEQLGKLPAAFEVIPQALAVKGRI